MKKIILFFLLSIGIQSCGQENESINKNNIETIELKKYESEPIYTMDIRSDYGYEILVNGFPISRNSYITGLYSVPLNYFIYWSGEQSIEIRIYPKVYENLNQEKDLKDGYFNLQINQREWTKENTLSEPKIIYSYVFPLEENSEKKMFVHKATFQANVPYQLTDWRKGRTFKEDSLILKSKVLKFYEKLKYSFEHQEGERYMQLIGTGFFNGFQSNYQTVKEFNDYYNHNKDFINKKERKLEPIENYKLQISGGGRLLSLRRIDGFNKGEGVLRFNYKKRGKIVTRIEDIVLYSPQSLLDDDYNLEVIWYMNQNKVANQ